jgi:hypothetical protein
LAVAGIDGDDQGREVVGRDVGSGVSRQRGEPDGGLAGRHRDAARRRHPDPQTGEAAGPDRYGDAVELEEFEPRLAHDARHQRHQGFGVPAHHRQRLGRQNAALVGIEDRGGTGLQGGIDGENTHQD